MHYAYRDGCSGVFFYGECFISKLHNTESLLLM
jgi:hypothetical protein